MRSGDRCSPRSSLGILGLDLTSALNVCDDLYCNQYIKTCLFATGSDINGGKILTRK